jgi:hypothetical protein
MVQEWNIMIQRQLTGSTLLSANYVGNHSGKIPYTNQFPNAYDEFGIYGGVAGIPSSNPNANYGVVSQVQNGGIGNYDGLTFTFRKQFSHGLVAHLNYTWAHGLDDVSNGGIFTSGDSTLTQINPLGLRQSNYGNSDYDIRNNFSADWVYTPVVHLGSKFMNELVGGWEVAGKAFWRTGMPFSITDNNTALGNYSGTILATYAPGATAAMAQPGSCGKAAAVTPCLSTSAFVDINNVPQYTAWSTQNRNQFRGPGFFDMDMQIFRTFRFRERTTLKAGIQAFNILNHPNFGQPDSGYGDSTYGQITGMSGTPTSPYGSFLGFDASPRIIQLSGRIVF